MNNYKSSDTKFSSTRTLNGNSNSNSATSSNFAVRKVNKTLNSSTATVASASATVTPTATVKNVTKGTTNTTGSPLTGSPTGNYVTDDDSVTYEAIFGQRSSISSCSSTDSYSSSTSSGASSLYSLKYIDEEESPNSPNDSLYSNSSTNSEDILGKSVYKLRHFKSTTATSSPSSSSSSSPVTTATATSPATTASGGASSSDSPSSTSHLMKSRHRNNISDDKSTCKVLTGHRFSTVNNLNNSHNNNNNNNNANNNNNHNNNNNNNNNSLNSSSSGSGCVSIKKLTEGKNWTPVNNSTASNVSSIRESEIKGSSIGVKAIRERILNATSLSSSSASALSSSSASSSGTNALNTSPVIKKDSYISGSCKVNPNTNLPLLLINDLDFSDLLPDDDTDVLSPVTSSSSSFSSSSSSTCPGGNNNSNNNSTLNSSHQSLNSNSSGNSLPPPPPPPLPNTNDNFNLHSSNSFVTSPPPPPPPLPLVNSSSILVNNKSHCNTLPSKSTVMLNRCLSTSVLNTCDTIDSSGKLMKNKRTVKLFWKEVKEEKGLLARLNRKKTIWDEIKPVNIDCNRLEVLFENRSKEVPNKKMQEGKKTELILLNAKRSNFINIGLKKLPAPRAIKTAILKMDSTIINREGIEKLLTMIPTEEEINSITEAKLNSPDLPLGTAESFLLILSQIPALEQRLKFWTFKIDFDSLEKEMGEQLMDLKLAMEEIEKSETFKLVLATLLAMGNFLNGNEVKGFQLEYLTKVPEVKDTIHKNSLLYHLVNFVIEKYPNSSDLYSELTAVTRASRVDYDELLKNLTKMESDCKLCWEYCNVICKFELSSSKESASNKEKMTQFVTNCSNRINVLQVVQRRVFNRFRKILIYLGFSSTSAKELKPHCVLKILSEFALEYRTTRERVKELLEKKSLHLSSINSSSVSSTATLNNKNRGRNVLEPGVSDSLSDHLVDCELRAILTQGYTDAMMDANTSSDYILPSSRGMRGCNGSNNSRMRKGKSIGNLYLASTISSCGSSTSSESSYYSTCSSSTSSNSADDELLETLVKTVTGGHIRDAGNRCKSKHSNSRLAERKSFNYRTHGVDCYDEDNRAMVYTSLHDVRLAQEFTY